MRIRVYSIVFGLALLATASARALALGLGDPAPPLTIAEWVQGDPVDLAKGKGKNVYLVEFWATWCPPCKVSVPLLSDLQDKYKRDLTIIGVTAPDFRGNSVEAIRKFVRSQDKSMRYHVAVDKNEATTTAYMIAAQVVGIPHAFLVDRAGLIAWQGSPLDPVLDGVIAKVVAGDYDVAAARVQAEVEDRLPFVFRALQMGQPDVAWDGLTDIVKLDPGNETVLDLLVRIHADQVRDMDAFRTWVRGHIDTYGGNAKAMYRLTEALCSISDLTMRVPDLALEAAGKAYEASEKRDPVAIAAFARAHFHIGELDRAITLQKDAVAAANGDNRDHIEGTLEYYNLCKRLQGKTN